MKISKILPYLRSYLFFGAKRIGFYANLGHGDLGDEASFLAVKKLLNSDILPISKKCYAFNPNILKAFLIGSGAVLRWESPYIPKRMLTRGKWDFPVALFSAGINCDYNKDFSEEVKFRIKKLCDICDYLSVRDAVSQRFLGGLGFDDVNILPDPELALEEKPYKPAFNKKGFTVGIVLSPHSEFSKEDFDKIVDVFSRFTDYLTAGNKDVIYLRFETKTSEDTKEDYLIKEIMKRVRDKSRIKDLKEDIGPEEMLSVIKNYCDIMVCMRLHAAIFSANAGIPFLCVTYNLMHDGFLEMMDARDAGLLMTNLSVESLKVKFEYVLNNYDGVKVKIISKRNYLRGLIDKEVPKIKDMIRAADDSICPVCGKRENTIFYYKNEKLDTGKFFYRILRCNNCGHLFSIPAAVLKQSESICETSRAIFLNDLERVNKKIKKLNSPWRKFILREYLGYQKNSSGNVLKYLGALFLSRFTSGNLLRFHNEGRILDVGCNNGLYLYLLKNLGWEARGVDVDRNACGLGKELGIDIFCGNLEAAGFSGKFFDVVRFNQVLEHIPDPKKTIEEAMRILKKDGKIYISVPNARSFAFFLFKDAWLDTGHVQGFTPGSIRYFCENLGLKVKSIRFSSSKNLLIIGSNYFFKRRGSNISFKNGFILRMAAAGFSFILNILHLSDTLTVEAENRSAR